MVLIRSDEPTDSNRMCLHDYILKQQEQCLETSDSQTEPTRAESFDNNCSFIFVRVTLPREVLHVNDCFRQRHSKALRQQETQQPRQNCEASHEDVGQRNGVASCGRTSKEESVKNSPKNNGTTEQLETRQKVDLLKQ